MITLEEVEACPKTVLVPADIAGILQIDAQDIRDQAREDKRTGKNSFGFPIIVAKRRIKIPKIPFIKYMRGELQNSLTKE